MKIKGIGVSPGIAIGKALLLKSEETIVSRRKVDESEIPVEIARLEEALTKTRAEIIQIQKKISEDMGMRQAEIFTAHLLVLEDRTLIEEVIARLKKEKYSVEYTFQKVLRKYIRVFSRMKDGYLKERVADIQDVGRRVLRNLTGRKGLHLESLDQVRIVVSADLSPSDTATMNRNKVAGIVTDIGGRTSHAAIMARSFEIPAVVGLEDVTRRVRTGDTLIVDGHNGSVIVNPDRETILKYEKEKKKFAAFERGLLKLKDLPAQTLDGYRVRLCANIEFPEELPSVIAHGADGIGLYRTEYFYMNRTDLPSEQEHYQAYRRVAEMMVNHPVIIRTMDLGGDKFLSQLEIPREMNPFMGWRAIRFSLARPEIFKTQLRAILRAGIHGNLKIMYPMISGINELREANRLLAEARQELKAKKIPFDEKMKSGCMIEVPSAALTCDILARETDFFSIGTNDLIQYSLAVDRVNEKIAYLYDPAHLAILRLLKNVIDTGHRQGLEVSMCGEMAGEVHYAVLLLGLGLDEFSTSAVSIPELKKLIRSVSREQARTVAEEALRLSTGTEVDKFLRQKVGKMIPVIQV